MVRTGDYIRGAMCSKRIGSTSATATAPYHWHDKSANDGYEGTAPVGSYANGISPFGVHDMIGNVWEWVQDRYGPYQQGLANDPTGSQEGHHRVMRGGSWDNNPGLCRATTRLHVGPNHRFDFVGFRLLRTQP